MKNALEQAALLDLTGDALIIRDDKDRIRFWNNGTERLYGWSANEAIGRNIQELLQESSKSHLESGLDENGIWVGELRQVTKSGKVVFVRSRLKVIRNESGSPESVLIANTDITELKTLESRLLSMKRMEIIDRLAGGIAHDLNNELSTMLLSVRVLAQKQEDPESRRWLEALRISGEHTGRLCTALLSVAKGTDLKKENHNFTVNKSG